MPDLEVATEAIVASGQRAAASFVYTGTHTAPFLGFAPTGRRLRLTSCKVFAVRDGQVAGHWGMVDIAGVLAHLHG